VCLIVKGCYDRVEESAGNAKLFRLGQLIPIKAHHFLLCCHQGQPKPVSAFCHLPKQQTHQHLVGKVVDALNGMIELYCHILDLIQSLAHNVQEELLVLLPIFRAILR
jgi:hypothetical protein